MILLVLTLSPKQAATFLVVAAHQNPAHLHRVILEPMLLFSSYSNEMLGMDYGSFPLPHTGSQQFKFQLKRKLLKCEDYK